LLEGKNINLRVAEKEDIALLAQWLNDSEFQGEYQDFPTQISKAQLEKRISEPLASPMQWVDFIIEKKDGTKIGWTCHYIGSQNFGWMEIGYALISSERGKGYGAEAAQIMVDYLFLTKEIARIQAVTNVKNLASQRVLEKVGFKREGTLRKALYVRGEWADGYLYSILREEWKNPKTLSSKRAQN
jgi:RimJ/RimL family protein N-acetyltransferase